MKGEQRKEQILQAARQVFAEHGYERTSIAMICDKVKIGRGTLYQYFKDKNSIFRELIERHAERVEKLMSSQEFDETISGLEEFITYRMRNVLSEIRDNKEIYKILLHEAPSKNAQVEDLVRDIRRRMIASTADDLSLGAKLGFYQIDDPELIATQLIGAVLHVEEYYFFDAEVPADPEELARKIARFQVRYLVGNQTRS